MGISGHTHEVTLLTDSLSLLTAVLTLVAVLLSMRKTYQTSRQVKAQTLQLKQNNDSAEEARQALHNHLEMIEAGVAAAADRAMKNSPK